MFALVVRFDLIDPPAAEAFDALVRDLLPSIRAEEPGTLEYATHRVVGDPLARVFYEIYRDPAAHGTHEARPAVAAFLARVPSLTTAVRVELLSPDTDVSTDLTTDADTGTGTGEAARR